MVDIQLTYNCNNNCISCILPEIVYNQYRVDTLTIKAEMRKNNSDIVCISGGEPTAHPEFLDLFEYAFKHNKESEIKVLTNGRTLSNLSFVKKIKEVVERYSNRFIFEVPFYGPEKNHDRITRAKNSFKQTFKGVKNLEKVGLPYKIRVIVEKKNHEKIPELAERIREELNPYKITFIAARYTGKGYKNFDKVGVKYEESVKNVEKAVDMLRDKKDLVELFHYPLCILDKEYRKFGRQGVTKQQGGITFLEKCEKCSIKKDCSGIWESYLEKFGGEEFEPF